MLVAIGHNIPQEDDGRVIRQVIIRRGEVWIGTLGLFWSRDIKGIELPSGRFIG